MNKFKKTTTTLIPRFLFRKESSITWFLLLLSLALIAVGLFLDQDAAVLAKAIRICLECVGIG